MNTFRVSFRPKPVLPEADHWNMSVESGPVEDEESDLNLIFYFPLLKEIFVEFSRCQEENCTSQLTLDIELLEKEVLCLTFVVDCSACGFSKSFKISRRQ